MYLLSSPKHLDQYYSSSSFLSSGYPGGCSHQGHKTNDPLLSSAKVMNALICICMPAYMFKTQDKSLPWTFTSLGMNHKDYVNANAFCSLQNLPFPNRVTCRTEGKKVIAQEIEWLPTDEIPFGARKVVEIFSIVTVELFRSPASLKVETRLLRPPSSAVFLT